MVNAALSFIAAIFLFVNLLEAARFQGGEHVVFLNAAENVNASVIRDMFAKASAVAGSNTPVPTVMDLFHIFHPSSPYKVKGATPEEEAAAVIEKSKAYVRSLMSRLAANSSIIGEEAGAQAQAGVESGDSKIVETPSLVGPFGLYFAQLAVGSPIRELNTFLIDTGSDITWLQCLPCENCFLQDQGPQGEIPFFDPSLSSSFEPMVCPSPTCTWLAGQRHVECNSNTCLYRIDYQSGLYTMGKLAHETFTINNIQTLISILFGCSHSATASTWRFGSGILGLGAGPLSIIQQLNSALFFCLPHNDNPTNRGFLGFGRLPQLSMPNMVRTQLLRSHRLPSSYYVPVVGISVNRVPISLNPLRPDGFDGTMLDTGTSSTVLQRSAYNAVRDAFRAAVAAEDQFPPPVFNSEFETCYEYMPDIMNVPSVYIHFDDGGVLEMRPENIFQLQAGGNACLAFLPQDHFGHEMNVLSGVQLAGFLIIINLSMSTVTFAPAACR